MGEESMRLDKAISSCTTRTRSEIKRLIAGGEVRVNGLPAARPEQKVWLGRDVITLTGKELEAGHTYLMLHKPAGVVCATGDKRHRTVLDLVPGPLRRKGLFPAGRLDKDTTGLVLLTDDGELAHRLLSPKRHVPKTYWAQVRGPLAPDAPARFAAGLVLEDGTLCRPATLQVLERGDPCAVRIVLHEGMYHQVKRMVAACGGEVTALRREKLGDLPLDGALPPGGCRKLTQGEVSKILGNG